MQKRQRGGNREDDWRQSWWEAGMTGPRCERSFGQEESEAVGGEKQEERMTRGWYRAEPVPVNVEKEPTT